MLHKTSSIIIDIIRLVSMRRRSLYFALTAGIIGITPAFASHSNQNFNEPSPSYEVMLDSCDYYLNRLKWDDAERSIRTCLRMQPASPLNTLLFYNLGMAQFNNYKPDKAEESFSLAIVRDELNPKYLLARSRARIHLIKLSEAEEDVDAVLAVDSLNTEALYTKALISRLLNHPEKAEPYLNKLLDLDTSDVNARISLSEILIGKGDFKAAYDMLKDYYSNDSEVDADLRFNRMLSLLYMENDEMLTDEIRAGIAAYPREGRFYMIRAALERRRFQNQDAEVDKKRALEFGVSPEAISRFLAF